MRTALVLVFLAIVALAAPNPSPIQETISYAGSSFLMRQKNILRLLVRIEQPNQYEDMVAFGNSYDIEANIQNYKYPQVVKQFISAYKKGFLPRGVPYSPYYTTQSYETKLLFDLFYYANDYDTFYKTAVWARDRINAGQFQYALSMAVFLRQDLNDIVLPPPYEIYPYLFVDADVIQKAYETKLLDQSLKSPKTYVFPANYTVYTPEQVLTYFTEDVGLSTYYLNNYYNYPTFFNSTEYDVQFDRRGELFYYTKQQLFARYVLERLSHDLPEVQPFDYRVPFQTAYYPRLRHANGEEVPFRPYEYSKRNLYTPNGQGVSYGNYYGGNNEYYTGNYHTGNYKSSYYYGYTKNYDYYFPEDINSYENRIRNGIDLGLFLSEGGQVQYPLYDDYTKGINYLGDIIEGNGDTVNKKFYGHIYQAFRQLAGQSGDPYNDYGLAPSALQNIFTALRDPANYQILKRINYLFQRYKNNLPAYTFQELGYPGVKIDSVDVEKLITYYDYFDIDLDNVVNEQVSDDNQYDYRARQTRLNHKSFTYTINVTSNITTEAYARVFIGPKTDYLGREYNINDRRHYFFEIDGFSYKIQKGLTTIKRNSRDSSFVSPDHASYRTLVRKVNKALEGVEQFQVEKSERYCGYPERLLIPRGKKGGQTFTFYVILTPYVKQGEQDFKSFSYCGVGFNNKYPDNKPFGFPFDRPIYGGDFYTSNSYIKDVVIFHKKQEEVNRAVTE